MLPIFFLWILYILLVAFPIVSSVPNHKKRSINDWIYGVTLIIILVAPFVIKMIDLGPGIDDNNIKNASFIYSIALSIVCIYCKHIINIREDYRILKKNLDSQMDNFINHPILNSKEQIDGVLTSMFALEGSRTIVRDFFIRSFREIQCKGAVVVDVTFLEYTELLNRLIIESSEVFGTFTTRPVIVKKQSESGEGCDKIMKYINTLNEHKAKINRVCVLEKSEIKTIAKGQRNADGNIEEIDWFEKNVPSKGLKWAETNAFKTDLISCSSSAVHMLQKKMIDFAICDDVFIRWMANENDHFWGSVIMLIGQKAESFKQAMNKYMSDEVYGSDTFDQLLRQFEKS